MADLLDDRLISIDDPDDPRVEGFRDIRERDLRGRKGLFVAEGSVVLRVLAEAHAAGRFAAERVLVLENRLNGIRDILAAFPPDVPIMTARREVIDRIAGFPMHRGVLALGSRPGSLLLEETVANLPRQALVLVASEIANHDNMGALFRNAAAFGADAVLLDAQCCDPLYRKAIRVSVGAVLSVSFAIAPDVNTMAEALKDADFTVFGLSPRGKTGLSEMRTAPRTALIVGAEGEGLPAALLGSVETLRIEQAPGFDSLNVAAAAGIALHAAALRMGRLGG